MTNQEKKIVHEIGSQHLLKALCHMVEQLTFEQKIHLLAIPPILIASLYLDGILCGMAIARSIDNPSTGQQKDPDPNPSTEAEHSVNPSSK